MKEIVPLAGFYANVFTVVCFNEKKYSCYLSDLIPAHLLASPQVNTRCYLTSCQPGSMYCAAVILPSNSQTKPPNQTERWNCSCLKLSQRFAKPGSKS